MLLAIDAGIRGSGAAIFFNGARADAVIRTPRAAPGELHSARYVKNPIRKGNGTAECLAMAGAIAEWVRASLGREDAAVIVDRIVWEWPRIYRESHKAKRTDNNDLFPLVGIGVGVCAFFPCSDPCSYFPHEWKGQTKKAHTKGRVLGAEGVAPRLSPAEVARVVRVGALDHNTIDAIGIGLKKLGRFERRRVIAR